MSKCARCPCAGAVILPGLGIRTGAWHAAQEWWDARKRARAAADERGRALTAADEALRAAKARQEAADDAASAAARGVRAAAKLVADPPPTARPCRQG